MFVHFGCRSSQLFVSKRLMELIAIAKCVNENGKTVQHSLTFTSGGEQINYCNKFSVKFMRVTDVFFDYFYFYILK